MTTRNMSLKPAWGEAKASPGKATATKCKAGSCILAISIRPRNIRWSSMSTGDRPTYRCRTGPEATILPRALRAWAISSCLPIHAAVSAKAKRSPAPMLKELWLRRLQGHHGFGVDEALPRRARSTPTALGIAGWSYGGLYMTMWAVTQTNRCFKAAMAEGARPLQLAVLLRRENLIDPVDDPVLRQVRLRRSGSLCVKSSPINFIQEGQDAHPDPGRRQ